MLRAYVFLLHPVRLAALLAGVHYYCEIDQTSSLPPFCFCCLFSLHSCPPCYPFSLLSSLFAVLYHSFLSLYLLRTICRPLSLPVLFFPDFRITWYVGCVSVSTCNLITRHRRSPVRGASDALECRKYTMGWAAARVPS